MTNERENIDDLDLGFDLQITKTLRRAAGGTWVCGTIHGHRFEALVFPEHAENPDYEIDDSRISKLWVQRRADRRQVYNWDRGADVPPAELIERPQARERREQIRRRHSSVGAQAALHRNHLGQKRTHSLTQR